MLLVAPPRPTPPPRPPSILHITACFFGSFVFVRLGLVEAVVPFVSDRWVGASVEELSKNKGPDASTILTVCGHDEGCPAYHEA